MARTISDEELQLKLRARRRQLGAVVLVTVVIVVLPMVLDSEPKQNSQEVSVKIPSPDSSAFTSKVVPLPAAPAAKPEPKAAQKKPVAALSAEDPKSVAVVTVAPTSPVAVKEAPKGAPGELPKSADKAVAVESTKSVTAAPAKAPANSAKTASKAKKGQFVVQVIALADAGKAKQMQQQIAAAGIKSYTEVVKTSKGDVTRVRAGPFASRAAAEKAREQLKALGMNGNVTTR
jgi:DedD protein